MAYVKRQLPLVVIYGPTGSGKTALAVRLAKEFNGEVISADSRAIYRGLDVGTAKPSTEERDGVPHWGIDIVDPGDVFTAADFKQYALKKINEIRSRNKVPILVGGTCLYIDAVVFDYGFPVRATDEERAKLNALSLDELHAYCAKSNITLPENRLNKRYVINTIVRNGQSPSRRSSPIENCIIVGITTERDELYGRLVARAERLVGDAVIAEAQQISQRYGWESEAMTANIYPLIRRYAQGQIGIDELRAEFITSDWRLAKRQRTWLKRNEYINWLSLPEAHTFCARELNKVNNS